jgi:integrase
VWGQSHWKTACKRANVRYDNIYDLRHLGATLLMVGPRWDFRRIAEFMGNSARVCEERYLHLAQWADEFKGKEMEEIIESVRSEPAANFERKLHLIDGSQSRPASEILRELST